MQHWGLLKVLDSGVYAEAVYERSKSYKSVRLTYKDLSNLLLATQEFLINLSTDSTYVHMDQVSIKDMSQKLGISGDYQLDAFTKAPTKAIYISYDFSATRHPIRRVEITLADYEREAVISGSSLTQVQALSAMIHEHLIPKETILGAEFRRVALFLIISIQLCLVGFKIYMDRTNSNKKILRYLNIAVILMAPIYISGLFIIPWQEWFPGTAIYSDTANFFERYGPEISFLSFLIGIPSLLALVIGIVSRKKENSSE